MQILRCYKLYNCYKIQETDIFVVTFQTNSALIPTRPAL